MSEDFFRTPTALLDIVVFLIMVMFISLAGYGFLSLVEDYNILETDFNISNNVKGTYSRTRYKEKCFKESRTFKFQYGKGPDLDLEDLEKLREKNCIEKKDDLRRVDGGIYYYINVSCIDNGTLIYLNKTKCSLRGYEKIEKER